MTTSYLSSCKGPWFSTSYGNNVLLVYTLLSVCLSEAIVVAEVSPHCERPRRKPMCLFVFQFNSFSHYFFCFWYCCYKEDLTWMSLGGWWVCGFGNQLECVNFRLSFLETLSTLDWGCLVVGDREDGVQRGKDNDRSRPSSRQWRRSVCYGLGRVRLVREGEGYRVFLSFACTDKGLNSTSANGSL